MTPVGSGDRVRGIGQGRRAALVLALVTAGLGGGGSAFAAAASPASSTEASSTGAASCPAAAMTAGAARTGPAGGVKLNVLTTVAPITSIVANVAGDRAAVTGIIPEGEDSHTYEPKPSAAKAMAKADVVFVNGLKLEDPTKELAAANLRKGAQIIELGTLTITPAHYIYDFSFPKDGGKPNPHLWTNPPMAACYARIAESVLSKADPSNAAVYRKNCAAFVAKVEALDAAMTAATATLKPAARKLLTYHDAYAYFALHYGWTVVGAVQVSSFEDPTPKEVASLIKQIRKEKVAAVFGSEVFPSPVLAQIAKEAGTKYVDKLRDDDLPGKPGDPDHSYLGLMKFDFFTMVSSLGGDASKINALDTADVAPDRAVYPQ